MEDGSFSKVDRGVGGLCRYHLSVIQHVCGGVVGLGIGHISIVYVQLCKVGRKQSGVVEHNLVEEATSGHVNA